MNLHDINKWDALARLHYTYVADPEGQDTWRSHADAVLDGKPWTGDCDDLSMTVIDLLGRAGVDLKDLYRLIVTAPNGQGHMLGVCTDNVGKLYCIGDTFFAGAYPATQMQHTPIRYNRMSEAYPHVIWRVGVPW